MPLGQKVFTTIHHFQMSWQDELEPLEQDTLMVCGTSDAPTREYAAICRGHDHVNQADVAEFVKYAARFLAKSGTHT